MRGARVGFRTCQKIFGTLVQILGTSSPLPSWYQGEVWGSGQSLYPASFLPCLLPSFPHQTDAAPRGVQLTASKFLLVRPSRGRRSWSGYSLLLSRSVS